MPRTKRFDDATVRILRRRRRLGTPWPVLSELYGAPIRTIRNAVDGRGTKRPTGRPRKLTPRQIARAAKRRAEGVSYARLAEEFGVYQSVMYRSLTEFYVASKAT